MEKQKSWQLYLILAVILLTLFNIMPTIFYYTKPLKAPIDAPKAHEIAVNISERVNSLETDAISWLHSFTNLLGVKPISIETQKDDPRFIDITFKSPKDATLFKRFLPRAGSLITFVPSQLELSPENEQSAKVTVSRKVGVRFEKDDFQKFFRYTQKQNEQGQISEFYRQLVEDRAALLAVALGGNSKSASLLQALSDRPNDKSYDDLVVSIATDIVESNKVLRSNQEMANRYFASFTQSDSAKKDNLISNFLSRAENLKTSLSAKKETLAAAQKKALENKQLMDSNQQQALNLVERQLNTLNQAIALLNQRSADFNTDKQPLTIESAKKLIAASRQTYNPSDKVQTISLEGHNPFVKAIVIDWSNEKLLLEFYPDVQKVRLAQTKTEESSVLREKLNSLVINDIARAARLTDENLTPNEDAFAIQLTELNNPQSFLALDLAAVAEKQSHQLLNQLNEVWLPKHEDLARNVYPINDYKTYAKLKPEEQKLGLVVYIPTSEAQIPGFSNGSLYVIARGMDSIMQKYRQAPNSPEKEELLKDVDQLYAYLQSNGFVGYSASAFGLPADFNKDYIFELNDYYSTLLKGTRENFYVKGSKQYALLDFTDVEQRILAENSIDDRIQEDLLKWQEEYGAAQVDLDTTNHYLVPAPTKNPYWQNLKHLVD